VLLRRSQRPIFAPQIFYCAVQFCAGEGGTATELDCAAVLALRSAVRDDVLARIGKWGKVNYVWCAAPPSRSLPCLTLLRVLTLQHMAAKRLLLIRHVQELYR
jgi:hypothetical protein